MLESSGDRSHRQEDKQRVGPVTELGRVVVLILRAALPDFADEDISVSKLRGTYLKDHREDVPPAISKSS